MIGKDPCAGGWYTSSDSETPSAFENVTPRVTRTSPAMAGGGTAVVRTIAVSNCESTKGTRTIGMSDSTLAAAAHIRAIRAMRRPRAWRTQSIRSPIPPASSTGLNSGDPTARGKRNGSGVGMTIHRDRNNSVAEATKTIQKASRNTLGLSRKRRKVDEGFVGGSVDSAGRHREVIRDDGKHQRLSAGRVDVPGDRAHVVNRAGFGSDLALGWCSGQPLRQRSVASRQGKRRSKYETVLRIDVHALQNTNECIGRHVVVARKSRSISDDVAVIRDVPVSQNAADALSTRRACHT